MADEPKVSVVIPTYNRCASLRRALDALRTQTYPLQHVEVIVVVNGSTDGTAQMLDDYDASFALLIVEQPNRGLAEARNRGAVRARGELLIFLDDDVEPMPSMIEAHAQAHATEAGGVVIGYFPHAIQESDDVLRIESRIWWEDAFQRMREPGHRYEYRDLLGGNFSLAAELYARVGTCDPRFSSFGCREDWDLGAHLIKAGVSLALADEIVGYHHEARDLNGVLERKHQEGRADVQMVRCHPELWTTLLLTNGAYGLSLMSRLIRFLAFAWPSAGDRIASGLRWVMDLLEGMHWLGRWRGHLGGLQDYCYWRGVAEEMGSRVPLDDLLQDYRSHPREDVSQITLDLREGLKEAEQRLDAERPTGVYIYYGQHYIGSIPPRPGAERLRGAHLRPILATEMARPLLRALAAESAIDQAIDPDCILIRFPIQ